MFIKFCFLKIKSIALLLLLFAFFNSGCKKDPPFSEIPELEFISISPNPAQQYNEEVQITFKYKDGDGDLGENEPGVQNLFITDSRNQLTYNFRIHQLAPDGEPVPIQGELTIALTSVALLDENNDSEIVSYSIYCEDRSGNQSNTIISNLLTITQ
jgi:hypothetical protein